MTYSVASYSALGRRKNNEDAFCADVDGSRLLAVVADGLGGMDNGEFASQQAVDTLRAMLHGKEVSPQVLREAILQANEDVLALHPDHPSAMTTVAAVWIDEGAAWAMHLGDSRIYHFRDGQILYQSVDHSLSQEAVEAGRIQLEDIRFHPDKNKLTQVIGDPGDPPALEHELPLAPGDRLLLCSDGFWEKIWESQMLTAADDTETAEDWLDEMRKIAETVAVDNNTAVAVIIL